MKICQYKETCESKTDDCWHGELMNELYAKPIVDGKFWIVEDHGNKVGVLKVTEQKKYVLSSKDAVKVFDTKKKLVEEFGKGFFLKPKMEKTIAIEKSVHGYPTSSVPHNPLYDVKNHLPLFTKSNKSKSIYCAGYYVIRFEKGWVKSFCPKLVTLEKYQYQGPFKTELEMKQRLTNVSK